MADINNTITLGIGSPADIEHFILWELNGATAGGAISAIDNDTSTAAAIGLRQLTGSLWMNERLRAHCNTAYGTSEVEIQPLIARWLKDIKS